MSFLHLIKSSSVKHSWKEIVWLPNFCITWCFMVTALHFLFISTQQYLALHTTTTKWGGRLALRCNFTCVLNSAQHVRAICTHSQLVYSPCCIHGCVKLSDIPDYNFWFLDKTFTVQIVLSPSKTSFFWKLKLLFHFLQRHASTSQLQIGYSLMDCIEFMNYSPTHLLLFYFNVIFSFLLALKNTDFPQKTMNMALHSELSSLNLCFWVHNIVMQFKLLLLLQECRTTVGRFVC